MSVHSAATVAHEREDGRAVRYRRAVCHAHIREEVAHLVRDGIGEHFVQEYRIGKRPGPRETFPREVGVFDVFAQDLQVERVQIALRHMSEQVGHALPPGGGGFGQQTAQVAGAVARA